MTATPETYTLTTILSRSKIYLAIVRIYVVPSIEGTNTNYLVLNLGDKIISKFTQVCAILRKPVFGNEPIEALHYAFP